MRYFLPVLLCVVLFLLAYIFWPTSHTVKNYPSSGTSVVAFGDSLVSGVGSTLGGGFVSILEKEIGVPIINLGKSGDTTEDGLARMESIKDTHPKVVMLLLGGNDYLRKIPQATTRTNLAKIIEEIQGQGAIVVLLGVRGGVLQDNFSDMYEELADTYETAYVSNVLEGLFARDAFMSGAIHPNDAGYEKIAERIAPVLAELLK